jgi:hypothetical protein
VQGQLPRYWVPFLPAVAIGAAGALRAAWSVVASRASGLARKEAAIAIASLVVLLGVFFVPVRSDITNNPRDHVWNSVRAYLRAHDREVNTLIVDDRDALTLSVYQVSAFGGDRVWHGRVVVVPHFQSQPPPPAPNQWLLWTGQLSKHPPDATSGWVPVLQQRGLGLYRAGVA